MSAAQLPLLFLHRPAMGREDFLVAASNSEAVSWLDAWPDWPAPVLVLHGPPGCGKTHLMQVWRARSRARALALDGLGRVDLSALRPADPETGAPAAAFALDRGELVAGDAEAETALFHLYNALRAAGGTLLIAARRPPSQWPLALPDLRSRLLAAPAAAVEAPDDGLLAAVLVKLFNDRQLRPGAEVVEFLLRHMERSFDAARRLVAAIDAAALAERRPVTVPLARAVLAAG
ncbi:MAG TPA: DnaA/Hda family protein [Alphaproteobacteria bacterium]|nr:DnaA/Hda family protein [Alphaproteobacteria bacterium]